MTETKRENGLDLLRILSSVAVVLIHVNLQLCKVSFSRNTLDYLGIQFFDTFTRFCVPCFLMISGAFTLKNEKNAYYKYFYKKSFFRLGIPFLFTCAALFITDMVSLPFFHRSLYEILNGYAKGRFYNLWYMFFFFGIYLLVPVILRFKNSVSKKTFLWTSIGYMMLAIVSMNTSESLASYSIGYIFSYCAYFILGSALYDNFRDKNIKVFAFLSVLFFTAQFTLNSLGIKLPLHSQVYFYPMIVLGSVFCFLTFAGLIINFNFGSFPRKTYFVYLFHTVILYLICKLIGNRYIFGQMISTVLLTAAVYIAALIAGIIYLKIWKIIVKKFNLSRFEGV